MHTRQVETCPPILRTGTCPTQIPLELLATMPNQGVVTFPLLIAILPQLVGISELGLLFQFVPELSTTQIPPIPHIGHRKQLQIRCDHFLPDLYRDPQRLQLPTTRCLFMETTLRRTHFPLQITTPLLQRRSAISMHQLLSHPIHSTLLATPHLPISLHPAQ